MCSITFVNIYLILSIVSIVKIYPFVVRLFLFQSKYRGKGKRDEHIISQIIFTRCLRLTLRTSKMPKNSGGGAYNAPKTPS